MIQYDLCSDRGTDESLLRSTPDPSGGRWPEACSSSWAEKGEGKVFQAVCVEARGQGEHKE